MGCPRGSVKYNHRRFSVTWTVNVVDSELWHRAENRRSSDIGFRGKPAWSPDAKRASSSLVVDDVDALALTHWP